LGNNTADTEAEMLASILPANADDGRPTEIHIPMAPVIRPPGDPTLLNPVYSIELLAANLERGLYAMQQASMLPASEQQLVHSLAAWHNKGFVRPNMIAASDELSTYAGNAWKRYTSNAKDLTNDISYTP